MEPKLQMSAAKTAYWKATHTGGVPIWTEEEEEETFEREARLDALMEEDEKKAMTLKEMWEEVSSHLLLEEEWSSKWDEEWGDGAQ